MSGNKCEFHNCGMSSKKDKSLRFYKFPTNDTERCKKWILNSGNGNLVDISPMSLKKKVICSKHFSEEQVLPKRLPLDAVPVKYISDSSSSNETVASSPDLKVKSVSKTYGNRQSTSLQVDQSEESGSSGNQYLQELQNLPVGQKRKRKRNFLSEENDRLRKEVDSLKQQLNNEKKKVIKAQLSSKILFKECTSQFSASLVKMQLAHRNRCPWTPAEKKTALSIYYKSPSVYKYLRQKGVILPGTSTIKAWLGNFNCWPGFNKKMLTQLHIKTQTMKDSEKICIVMFDEMSLKRNLDYNQKIDKIEGIENLGSLGRKPILANQALVFMIRGIYSSWKIPVAYVVSKDGVNAHELQTLLLNCLEHLVGVNLKPIGIVCDVSAVNQQLYKKLDITKEKPYFLFKEKIYVALYDTPHLLKCLRNNFLNSYFLYKDKKVDFGDIRKVFEIDSSSKSGRCLLKLTNKHLNPNGFEKMSVKLAAQLFSNSVAAALKVAVRSGELQTTTAENTAYFIKTINNLFDALNSTQFKNSNPYNRVLSDKNPQVLEALNSGYELMENLCKKNLKGDFTRPPSFDGFLQTINAVKMIFLNQKNKGFSFLFTGRLIQDPLENQFSIYRQRGGYNRNPTVKSFRAAFKINIVSNLIKPANSANSGTNIDSDDNIFDFDDALMNTSVNLFLGEKDENIPEVSNSSESDSSVPTTSSNSKFSLENFSLENCSTTYFAGYLVKKVLKKYNCDLCRKNLEGKENLENADELLIFYKNYDIEKENLLKTPTNSMKNFTKICITDFNDNMKKFLNKRVVRNMKRKIIVNLEKNIPDWFNVDENCKEHIDYIFELLLRTLIFKYCKTVSKSMTTRAHTKNVKLSILQHR